MALAYISFSMQAVLLVVFLPAFLIVAFGQEGDCAVSIGGENQEILLASVEKIEAGGELNCMSRGLGCDDKAAAGK